MPTQTPEQCTVFDSEDQPLHLRAACGIDPIGELVSTILVREAAVPKCRSGEVALDR